jgi:hypothetical protein
MITAPCRKFWEVRVQARRSVAVVTLRQLRGTPETAGLDACSVCSNWRVAVAATHRERKPYSIACPFDPHRPYQTLHDRIGNPKTHSRKTRMGHPPRLYTFSKIIEVTISHSGSSQ